MKPTTKSNRYTYLALNGLIASVAFFLLLLGTFLFNTYTTTIENISLISIIGFVVSNICGFVFSLMSYLKREEESVIKVVSIIGNSIIFIVVLGMLSFIGMDLITVGK